MKQLFQGKIEALGASYDLKVEDGKLEAKIDMDLMILVDKGAVAVPGDSTIEQLVVGLIKQSIKAL